MNIPERFNKVKYCSAKIPGVDNEADLTLGANCQVFAYALLRHFGLNPPPLRSSELWSDTQFTKNVSEFEALDIMMYNNKDQAYGAHVGVYPNNFKIQNSVGIKIDLDKANI